MMLMIAAYTNGNYTLSNNYINKNDWDCSHICSNNFLLHTARTAPHVVPTMANLLDICARCCVGYRIE